MTELNFPPLRDRRVALPLAIFGLIACALAAIGVAVMLSSDTGGPVAAILMVIFVAPLGVFGAIFVALALYMALNGLSVTVGDEGIETRRTIFGFLVARKRIGRSELRTIEPEIASRYQSVFDTEPTYLLVARDATRRMRVIVAESLRGEARMGEVRSLIERAAGLAERSTE